MRRPVPLPWHAGNVGCPLPRGDGLQSRKQLSPICRRDQHALGKIGPADVGRMTDVGQLVAGICLDRLLEVASRQQQSVGLLRRDLQDVAGSVFASLDLDRERRLSDDDVRIGSTKPEAADTGDPRCGTARPGHGGSRNDDPRSLDTRRLDRSFEMRLRRYRFVLEALQRLDQSCKAAHWFQMSDVGFDGSDITGLVVAAGKHFTQRRELGGIAEVRAGSVRLDIADHGRIDASRGLRRADHFDLQRTIRCDHAAGFSAVVDGRAGDHAHHASAFGGGRPERL